MRTIFAVLLLAVSLPAFGATTVHPRQLRTDVVNVLDRGAKCDGTTDDTAAIQSAVDSLPLNAGAPDTLTPRGFSNGGTVLLPRGRCKVTDTIHLHRGVRITGVSSEASQILSFAPGSVFQYLDAGRDILDEIVVENLSIWQDSSVTPTSGAGIEINTGTAAVQGARFRGANLLVVGTYHGVKLQAGIASSLRDAVIASTVSHGVYVAYDGASPTVTTSTTFQNVYSYSSQTGDGFRLEYTSYCSCITCASDSNAGYGYYVDNANGTTLLNVGAEQNGPGAIYLHAATSTFIQARIVTLAGAKHGIVLDNAPSTFIGPTMFSSDAGTTGYAIHVAAVSAGGTVVSGANYTGGHLTNKIDNTQSVLFMGSYQSSYLLGGSTPNYTIGNTQSVDTSAQLGVSGAAASTTYSGVKSNPTFTSPGTNVQAMYTQAITDNTVTTYPVVMDHYAPAVAKGAASTITRAVGVAVAQQTVGSTANAAYAACTIYPAAGNWGIASACTEDSYFTGPVRLGGASAPQFTSATAAPTTGTWAQGSRVFNAAAAVGSPKGWVCTVGGTPGTWVSEGNL